MLHFYHLLWLNRISSFSGFHGKIVDKNTFKTQLLSFLDQVIKCKLIPINTNQVLSEIRSSALATNNTFFFAL